jgi:hypothetical protein
MMFAVMFSLLNYLCGHNGVPARSPFIPTIRPGPAGERSKKESVRAL